MSDPDKTTKKELVIMALVIFTPLVWGIYTLVNKII
jgi:hypothetical protein